MYTGRRMAEGDGRCMIEKARPPALTGCTLLRPAGGIVIH